MTRRLVGQVGGMVLLTDDTLDEDEWQLEPAHDFSHTSTDDLIQMLKDCNRDGLTAGFIDAVREELLRRVGLNPFREYRLPPCKWRYWYQYDGLAHRDAGRD